MFIAWRRKFSTSLARDIAKMVKFTHPSDQPAQLKILLSQRQVEDASPALDCMQQWEFKNRLHFLDIIRSHTIFPEVHRALHASLIEMLTAKQTSSWVIPHAVNFLNIEQQEQGQGQGQAIRSQDLLQIIEKMVLSRATFIPVNALQDILQINEISENKALQQNIVARLYFLMKKGSLVQAARTTKVAYPYLARKLSYMQENLDTESSLRVLRLIHYLIDFCIQPNDKQLVFKMGHYNILLQIMIQHADYFEPAKVVLMLENILSMEYAKNFVNIISLVSLINRAQTLLKGQQEQLNLDQLFEKLVHKLQSQIELLMPKDKLKVLGRMAQQNGLWIQHALKDQRVFKFIEMEARDPRILEEQGLFSLAYVVTSRALIEREDLKLARQRVRREVIKREQGFLRQESGEGDEEVVVERYEKKAKFGFMLTQQISE